LNNMVQQDHIQVDAEGRELKLGRTVDMVISQPDHWQWLTPG